MVYELFVTKLPQSAFTAADVVALYLHRGAFENALADEDLEQEPDRWVSHTAPGQETWQIISQWTWNAATASWDTSSHRNQRARRNLRLLFHRRTNPRLRPLLPLRDMLLLPPQCPGKLVALPAQIFPSNQMGRCVALLEARSCRMNTAEKPMAACAWCMVPAFAVAVRVRCASSANGMATQRLNRVR
jgi:hypothetical protein